MAKVKQIKVVDCPGLGDRIIQEIKNSEFSVEGVCELLDVSRQFFYRAIAEDGVIKLEMIEKIEQILGIDLGVNFDE